MTIPELEPGCGSWVVVRTADQRPVGEFFDRRDLVRLAAISRPGTLVAKTALQHLTELNRKISENSGPDS